LLECQGVRVLLELLVHRVWLDHRVWLERRERLVRLVRLGLRVRREKLVLVVRLELVVIRVRWVQPVPQEVLDRPGQAAPRDLPVRQVPRVPVDPSGQRGHPDRPEVLVLLGYVVRAV